MPSSLADFPSELQNLIVESAPESDMGSFGLVNKFWLHSSRLRLFGSVTVSQDSWEGFVHLLESPLVTFARSVTTLTISLTMGGTTEAVNKLVMRLRELPTLGGVRCLRVERVEWHQVTETTAHSLVAMFPDLSELGIYRVFFVSPQHMAALVARFRRLQTVSISDPLFRPDGSTVSIPKSEYPEIPHTLRRLHLRLGAAFSGPFHMIVPWMHAGNAPSAIHVLELGVLDAQSLPSAGKLIRALGPELHDLDLKFVYDLSDDEIRTHIDLSQNTNIHSLTIHLSLRLSHTAQIFSWIRPITTSLALLALPHSLIRTLTLVLFIDKLDLIDALDWAALNTVLRTHPQFAALRRLNFMVHCYSVIDTVEEAIRARVPEHDARGIVHLVSWFHMPRQRKPPHDTWRICGRPVEGGRE
ncbi:hypothetical protein K438DRAFT_2007629 [Mycena galopus ATCC 62051]|nr:hypothetical protein K438DRAFT_2007629 [Mycena galopus ATCC 62051]